MKRKNGDNSASSFEELRRQHENFLAQQKAKEDQQRIAAQNKRRYTEPQEDEEPDKPIEEEAPNAVLDIDEPVEAPDAAADEAVVYDDDEPVQDEYEQDEDLQGSSSFFNPIKGKLSGLKNLFVRSRKNKDEEAEEEWDNDVQVPEASEEDDRIW